MFESPKLAALQIEKHVFQRLYDHWQELENGSLPAVLDTILAEIEKEEIETWNEVWRQAQKF